MMLQNRKGQTVKLRTMEKVDSMTENPIKTLVRHCFQTRISPSVSNKPKT